MKPKKISVWKILELVNWISNSINSGRLVEIDESEFYQETIDKFAEEIKQATSKSPSRGMTKRVFHAKIMELLWTKDRLDALKRAIQDHLDLETFQQYYSMIPMDLVAKRAEVLSGSVSMKVESSSTQVGMLRLITSEELDEI